jgi:hypothetical protein
MIRYYGPIRTLGQLANTSQSRNIPDIPSGQLGWTFDGRIQNEPDGGLPPGVAPSMGIGLSAQIGVGL